LHNIRFLLNRKEPYKYAKIVNKGNIDLLLLLERIGKGPQTSVKIKSKGMQIQNYT